MSGVGRGVGSGGSLIGFLFEVESTMIDSRRVRGEAEYGSEMSNSLLISLKVEVEVRKELSRFRVWNFRLQILRQWRVR